MNSITKSTRLSWALWTDERVPWTARGALLFALSYYAWPYDLIPDNIPYWGYVDDICVMVVGLLLAFLLTPLEVINDYWGDRDDKAKVNPRLTAETNFKWQHNTEISKKIFYDKSPFITLFIIVLMVLGFACLIYRDAPDYIRTKTLMFLITEY